MAAPFPGTGKIWMNGSLVDWADATIHIGSHVIHYGSGVFEGARCYDTPRGSACFRLDAHLNRLFDSAKIYRMEARHSYAELHQAVMDTIKANQFKACYIRPLIFRGLGRMGVNPLHNSVETVIAVWDWGKYLGDEALEAGVDVQVSSWNRNAPNTTPSLAKAGGNYLNGSLIKMEAVLGGFTEGIALDANGRLSEGSGQNLFLVRDEILYTPPVASSVLPGITRDSVFALAQDLGLQVREQELPREMIYIADEVFFAGTAVEITPIRSVDRIAIGSGKRGPVTAAIQQAFFDYVSGVTPDRHGWLTPVEIPGVKREPAAAAIRK